MLDEKSKANNEFEELRLYIRTFGWPMVAFTLSEAKGYRGTTERIIQAIMRLDR